jgi:transglutaminase-like putative cysteine protease
MRIFSRSFTPLFLALFLSVSPALAAVHSGVVTVEVDLSAQSKGEEARLWLPYPVSDADQLISDVRISGDYASAAVYTDRENGTPMLAARWDKTAASRKLSFSFAVERQEVRRRDLPATESAWNSADFALYLQPTRLGPTGGEVKKLADQITRGQTSVLGKARAIYDWVCENMYRDPATRGCGAGDVCILLVRPGGKCADISSVYIALARAAGVPAREIFGIRLGRKVEENISTWQHCWVEFYLPGTGWVPVDPADVRKAMLTEQLALDDPKTAERRAYFWGGIDPYRVKLGTGRDLTLNPPQAGDPLNYLMYPHAEVGGRILDWLDPATFKYTITYRQR